MYLKRWICLTPVLSCVDTMCVTVYWKGPWVETSQCLTVNPKEKGSIQNPGIWRTIWNNLNVFDGITQAQEFKEKIRDYLGRLDEQVRSANPWGLRLWLAGLRGHIGILRTCWVPGFAWLLDFFGASGTWCFHYLTYDTYDVYTLTKKNKPMRTSILWQLQMFLQVLLGFYMTIQRRVESWLSSLRVSDNTFARLRHPGIQCTLIRRIKASVINTHCSSFVICFPCFTGS